MTLAIQALTLDAFLHLPNIEESPAWEFIAGEMLQKPRPTTHHSILQKRLVAAIALISGETVVPVLPGVDLQITARQIFDWLHPR